MAVYLLWLCILFDANEHLPMYSRHCLPFHYVGAYHAVDVQNVWIDCHRCVPLAKGQSSSVYDDIMACVISLQQFDFSTVL